MNAYLLPDTTVLCNYASVHRLALLEEFLAGGGRWTQAVAREVKASARTLPDLRAVTGSGGGWLGRPVEVFDVDVVEDIRIGQLGGRPERPHQHLGEAETCHLLSSDPEFFGAGWITDDLAAHAYGRALGLATSDTRSTVEELIGRGRLSAEEGFDLLTDMRAAGRYPRRVPISVRDLLQPRST